MQDNHSRYLRVAQRFSLVLATVGDDQWANQSPCEEWTAADVASHVIATHQRVYSMADPQGIVDVDSQAPLLDQWYAVTRAFQAAIDDPAIANLAVQTRAGEQPFSQLIEGLVMTDTLCHTWDLATAVCADDELDPDAMRAAFEMLQSMGDAIRVAGGFKEAITPEPLASEQTAFLNFAGRMVTQQASASDRDARITSKSP